MRSYQGGQKMANNDLRIKVTGEFDSSGITLGLNETANTVANTSQQVNNANSSIQNSTEALNNALSDSNQIINQAGDSLDNMRDSTASASNSQNDLASNLAISNVAFENLTEGLKEAIVMIKDYIAESINLANSLEQTKERLHNMQLSSREADDMIAKLKQTSFDTGTSVKDLSTAAEILAKAGINAGDSLDYVNTLATASGQSIEETADVFAKAMRGESEGIDKLKESFGITNEQLTTHGIKLDELGEVTIKTAREQEALANAIKEIINANYSDAIDRHGKSLQGAIEDLSSTIDRLKTTTGELIAPVLSEALNALTRLLKAFESLPEPVKNTVSSLGLLVTITTTIQTSLPIIIKAWTSLASVLELNATSATANATAQTASATATSAGGTAAAAASGGYTALAVSVGLVVAKLALLIEGFYAANIAITESKEAVKALTLADNEETEAIKRRTEALKTGKNAYSEITAEVAKAGAVLNRNTTVNDVEKMIAGGISLEKVKSAANRARLYAEELTKFASESPTQENRGRASLAREQASQLSAGAEIYAKYQEQAKKSLEESLKTSKELKKKQEEAAKMAEKKAQENLKAQKAAEMEAKKAAEIEAKNKAIAQAKAIEEHTLKSLASIEEKRKKTIEAKTKTELQAIDTAIQRMKALLRTDETILSNSKARETVEKRIRDLTEERRQKENEIAKIRKSAEQSLAEAKEKYNKERISTLEQELNNTSPGSSKYGEIKSELDKRKEQSSLYERQGIINDYNSRIQQAGSESNATILKNALKYELLAQAENRNREQSNSISKNDYFAQNDSQDKNASSVLSNSVNNIKTTFEDLRTAGSNTSKTMQELANLNLTGVISALQSLTTSAMGAAGALAQISQASKNSSNNMSFNQNISINGNMQGSDVDTEEILKRGMNKIQSSWREREKFNDIMGG